MTIPDAASTTRRNFSFAAAASVFLALGLALAAPAAAHADTVTWDGVFDSSSPTWNRPFADCTGQSALGPVVVDVQPFWVSETANYTLTVTNTGGSWDPYGFVYITSFDPTLPNAGCVAGNDDSDGSYDSSITTSLDGATQYFQVTTAFEYLASENLPVAFRSSILGSGTVKLGTLPAAEVTVDTADVSIAAGATTTTFTLALSRIPSADVTVPLTSADPVVATVPATVVIPDAQWETGVVVTVTAAGARTADATTTIVTGDPTSADAAFEALGAVDIDDVEVAVAAVPITTEPPTEVAELPETGSDATPAMLASVALLGSGALLLALRRRAARAGVRR